MWFKVMVAGALSTKNVQGEGTEYGAVQLMNGW